jgi:hypothetical protein
MDSSEGLGEDWEAGYNEGSCKRTFLSLLDMDTEMHIIPHNLMCSRRGNRLIAHNLVVLQMN